MISIQRVLPWAGEVWRWFANAGTMFLLVLTAAGLHGFWIWGTEFSIRISGWVLQLLGIVVTIRGLWLVRRHFDHPSLSRLFFKWIKGFPRFTKHHTMKAETGTLTITGGEFDSTVWITDNPEQPLTRRIENLAKNVDMIRESQREHRDSIYRLKKDLKDHKQKMSSDHEKLQDRIRGDLESLHTADLRTYLAALLWIAVGLTVSAFAPELAHHLKP